MNASMLLHVRAAYNGCPPTVGFAVDAPTPSILLNRALKKWGGLWLKKFDRLSLDLSRRFADKNFNMTQVGMRAAFADAGFTVKFKPTRASIEAYHAVAAEQVNLIKSIPQQYLTAVRSSVWESVRVGADMNALSKSLRKNYGVSVRRAALIARDQNNKAKAIIENTRRQELGIVKGIWMHSHGGKEPRPTHVEMDGKPYDLKKGMYDSAEGKFIWPGQLINCRCTSKSVIPGFDDE